MFALLLVLAAARSASAQQADEGHAFFEKAIRPVLVQHCYQCHSAEAAAKGKLQAGLSLDTKQGLLTGGESGPAVVPGDAAKSLIVRALKFDGYEMPPSGKLPARVVADFEKWVTMGAPDPRDAATGPTPRRAAFQISQQDREHWAFQPVASPTLPNVKQDSWVRDDLDRFVLAPLERTGRRPQDEADRHALLRRLTFAITGLPPTPTEVAEFLADDSPTAYQRAVDRLLNSAEFGVHWGRHWLDGVRYADNIDKSGEYRRWVVRAFNEDLPYDRFVKLQIAGDLLPPDPATPRDRLLADGRSFDGVTATGMMSLAVWEQVGRDLAVAEIVDSQIDLLGRQMLGLTLACARCHDHKFDPISTGDYYSLAGILFSSHIATGKLIADARLGNDLVEIPLLSAEDESKNRRLEQEAKQLETAISALAKKIPQAHRVVEVAENLEDLSKQLAKATSSTTKASLTEQSNKLKAERDKLLADQKENGWELNPPELTEIAALRGQVAEVRKRKAAGPAVVAMREGGVPGSNRQKIGDAPIYLRGEYQREGAIVPRRFPVILAGEKQTPIGERTRESGRRELAEWIASRDNPLTPRVMVNRVWQQMIGRGLVRSIDNFGRLGERPTHPELLDHLARRFIDNGWSVKQLVRAIALSATYRQSSFVSPEEHLADPENRSLGHMNRHRLSYEELRDALLRLSVDGEPPRRSTKSASEPSRRTMFESQDRRKIDTTAAMFDGPDPKAIVPQRAESTTAPQALFLMNNKFVTDTANKLAARLEKNTSLATDRDRITHLWLLVLGRQPDDDEVELATKFLAKNAWPIFIQAVLASNEFAYVD